MEFDRNIVLGKGVGKINFQMTKSQVEALLGKADEIENFSYSDSAEDLTEVWHYDELDLSMSFDEEYNYTLTTIAISSDQFTLEGKHVMGKAKTEILSELNKLELGDYYTEDFEDEITMIFFEQFGLHLWFEQDVLNEIQIHYFEDQEHAKVIPFSAN